MGTFLWLVSCVVLGLLGSTIQWGDPDGFHGTGWPIPMVMWDRPAGSDHFLDYPNPAGGLLNVLVLMIAGLVFRGVFVLMKRIFRREPKGDQS